MDRYRDDNATQVWLGDQLVGWLTSVDGSRLGREIVVRSDSGPTSAWLDPGAMMPDDFVVEHHAFPTRRRSIEIDHFQMISARNPKHFVLETKIKAGVPPYATETRLANKDAIRFDWRVVFLADAADYEFIFDLEDFVPFDQGAPDYELRREQNGGYFTGGVVEPTAIKSALEIDAKELEALEAKETLLELKAAAAKRAAEAEKAILAGIRGTKFDKAWIDECASTSTAEKPSTLTAESIEEALKKLGPAALSAASGFGVLGTATRMAFEAEKTKPPGISWTHGFSLIQPRKLFGDFTS